MGGDDESEFDHGVGGLDPAHQDNRRVNGQENGRERPALITIKNKNVSEACNARGSSDRKYFQSKKILSTTGSVERGTSDTKYSLTTKVPGKISSKTDKKGRVAIKTYPTAIPTTLPAANNLLSQAPTRQQAWQHIIQTKNSRELPQAKTIFDRERVTRMFSPVVALLSLLFG